MAKLEQEMTDSEKTESAKKKGSLKVRPEDNQTVNLIATYRGLSVEELFKEPDFQKFLNNCLEQEEKKRRAKAKP